MFKFIANVTPEDALKIIKYTEEVLLEKSNLIIQLSKSSRDSLRKIKPYFSGQIKKNVSIDTPLKTLMQGVSKITRSEDSLSRDITKRSDLEAKDSLVHRFVTKS